MTEDLRAPCGVKRVRISSPTDVTAAGEFLSTSQDNLELSQQQARRKLLSQRLSNIQARHNSSPGKSHSSSTLPEHELQGRPSQSRTRLPRLTFSFGDSDCNVESNTTSEFTARNELQSPRNPDSMRMTKTLFTGLAVDNSSDLPGNFPPPQPSVAPASPIQTSLTQSPHFSPSAHVDADRDSRLKHFDGADFASQEDFNPQSAFPGSIDENNKLLDFIHQDGGSVPEVSEEELVEFLKWIKSQNLPTSTLQSRLQHLTNARAKQFSIERHALLNLQDVRQSVQTVYNDLVAAEQELERFVQ